jgi:glycosyltransferase involved in cell wall biosynthesis
VKIALIVQRCGKEVNGGAEAHCLSLARELRKCADVEILTTCARDYISWADYYVPGLTRIDGVPVRRFRVDRPRQRLRFDRFSEKLLERWRNGRLKQSDQLAWMRRQGPRCSRLTRFIRCHGNDYDYFIFFTYLYATTFDNLPLVAHKAWLVPTAHDEWQIYLPIFRQVFSRPRGFFFNTTVERDFLRRLFPDLELPGPIIGAGVDEPTGRPDPSAFRERTGIIEPFLLYLGRIDENKGCGKLFEWFLQLRAEEREPRKLVLCGKAEMPVPEHPDIIALGFVDPETKWQAIAACDWLLNFSPFESLSFVLLEAWSLARPTLVTDACAVLVEQTRRSGGGLAVQDFPAFRNALAEISATERDRLGRSGQAFLRSHYTWDRVIAQVLAHLTPGETGPSPACGP